MPNPYNEANTEAFIGWTRYETRADGSIWAITRVNGRDCGERCIKPAPTIVDTTGEALTDGRAA